MELVTIIIPAYNSQQNIRRCILSILSQTYKNIEIIIVNDGSKDNTMKICEKLSNRYSNIYVINTENFGVAHARNIGLRVANGKYILFVDSDDYISTEFVYKMISNLEYDKVIMCTYDKITLEGKKNTKSNNNLLEEETIIEYDKEDFIDLYEKTLLSIVWNKLYILDIIKKYDIHFNEELSLGEDLIFNLEYFRFFNVKIKLINEPLYFYVPDNNGLNLKYREDAVEIQHTIYKSLLNYAINIYHLNKNSIYRLYFLYLNEILHKMSGLLILDKDINLLKKILKVYKIMYNDSFIELVDKMEIYGIINKKFILLLKHKCLFMSFIYLKVLNTKNQKR